MMKAAKHNIALRTAFIDNSVKATYIFQAPSATGLQQSENKVGSLIDQMLQDDLKREITYLKDIIVRCSHPRDTRILVGMTAATTTPNIRPRLENTSSQQLKHPITEKIAKDMKIISCIIRKISCARETSVQSTLSSMISLYLTSILLAKRTRLWTKSAEILHRS